jgi:hypothetical protein
LPGQNETHFDDGPVDGNVLFGGVDMVERKSVAGLNHEPLMDGLKDAFHTDFDADEDELGM